MSSDSKNLIAFVLINKKKQKTKPKKKEKKKQKDQNYLNKNMAEKQERQK